MTNNFASKNAEILFPENIFKETRNRKLKNFIKKKK